MKKKIEEKSVPLRGQEDLFITILRQDFLTAGRTLPFFSNQPMSMFGIRTNRLIYVLVSPSEAKSDKGERHGIDREP